jgi:arabinose-5-phosphate isomerase
MGKSGHIGAKIAATLASTGTPAFFVHPAEMGHGDLGMLKSDDLVLALSFSGNTEELRKVLPAIKKLGVPLISITAGKDSALAQVSDLVLLTPITQEACPLDLAPTSSTTATLVMGDALAVALMKAKNFQAHDFARSHPLGSLGRSFMQISEIMRTTEIPSVNKNADLKTVLQEIDAKSLGFTTIIDTNGQILGIITDGDLRRAQIKFGADVFNKLASQIMNNNPKTITPDTLASQAAEILKSYRISSLVVVDNQKIPLGIIDLKDMLAEGFVI